MFNPLKNLKINGVVAVFLIATLSACTPQGLKKDYLPKQSKVRLPYTFQVSHFVDRRPVSTEQNLADTLIQREKYPFMREYFLKRLVKSINTRGLYEYDPAFLNLTLKDYAAVEDGKEKIVSFYVDVTAVDENEKVLASGLYSCLKTTRQEFDLHGVLNDVMEGKDTSAARENKVWQKLYAGCLEDVAHQVATDILDWNGRRGIDAS